MLQFIVGSFRETRDPNPPIPSLRCLFKEIFGGSPASSLPPVPSLSWFCVGRRLSLQLIVN